MKKDKRSHQVAKSGVGSASPITGASSRMLIQIACWQVKKPPVAEVLPAGDLRQRLEFLE